jgi:hypothetical protein
MLSSREGMTLLWTIYYLLHGEQTGAFSAFSTEEIEG